MLKAIFLRILGRYFQVRANRAWAKARPSRPDFVARAKAARGFEDRAEKFFRAYKAAVAARGRT